MTSRRVLFLVFVVAWALSLGCATPSENNVSTIPWNRPQSWEGSGGYGGFRPPGTPGY